MADLEQPVNIEVDWTDVASLPTMAANVFLIQQSPHEFTISFGYATLPVFRGTPSPDQIRAIKSIPAKAFAKISLAPGRMVELLQLLQQQIQAFQSSQKQ